MTDEKMPFTEHLTELRKRIIVSLAALLIGFIVSFSYSEEIFEVLTLPLRSEMSFSMHYPFVSFVPAKIKNPSLVFLAPAEAFWMHLKVSFVAGLILSLPIILHQFWKFISPGLLLKEKKYIGPFVVSASLLFLAGALFCFLLVLPFAMGFLLTYKTGSMTPMLSVGNYVDFCLKFILAFGAVFELPIIIVLLTRMGIVTPKTLAKNRKYAILIAFVIAALLTPTPDAFNQTLMAVPIIVLYEAGILVSRLFVRKRTEDAQRQG
ncbi:MAG: twin-arginine translocase subunit TatC [Nitrospirae bacterium]|nr:twin-arginine translocase subunit TatC [Nitrospirota bacterium]MCL5422280.1 twin-arginine translocase subunit TatC [Nitrospirota bacterium]